MSTEKKKKADVSVIPGKGVSDADCFEVRNLIDSDGRGRAYTTLGPTACNFLVVVVGGFGLEDIKVKNDIEEAKAVGIRSVMAYKRRSDDKWQFYSFEINNHGNDRITVSCDKNVTFEFYNALETYHAKLIKVNLEPMTLPPQKGMGITNPSHKLRVIDNRLLLVRRRRRLR